MGCQQTLGKWGFTVVVVGNVNARVEDDLAWVQDALVVTEEARCKVEAEVARLKVERTSLVLEIEVT